MLEALVFNTLNGLTRTPARATALDLSALHRGAAIPGTHDAAVLDTRSAQGVPVGKHGHAEAGVLAERHAGTRR